ncbi:hypothetical protein ACFU8X_20760 [Brevibacillus porteri]|uniref:hypothetical protein n=1 Tax=Brevibacillus porteri TaxID=2126350 RepID=UPI00370B5FA1
MECKVVASDGEEALRKVSKGRLLQQLSWSHDGLRWTKLSSIYDDLSTETIQHNGVK